MGGCLGHISGIKVPTMFLMAENDPILGRNNIDYKECAKNPNVLVGVTRSGGHLGYFESPSSTEQWFVHPVLEFFEKFRPA